MQNRLLSDRILSGNRPGPGGKSGNIHPDLMLEKAQFRP